MGAEPMPDFQFYVTDDRYSVPSLLFVAARDARSARTMAERMLDEEHHHGVEVWRDERKLFSVAEADPSAA
jgi:hypothetical protein